ncbi:MAG: hypothetical protein OYH77_06220, partial [Pseudomonadota bacterium]|nr:hypothetical protein [Pseudomonadota bacterium]
MSALIGLRVSLIIAVMMPASLLAVIDRPSQSQANSAQPQVWLRLSEAAQQLALNAHGNYLAYVPQSGIGLKIINLKTKNIYAISTAQVGAGFFWASGGFR